MAKGSQQPSRAWAGEATTCVDCGRKPLVKEICHWFSDYRERRFIRCCECLALQTSRYVKVVSR